MKTIAILGVAVFAFTATAAPLQLVSQRSGAVAASASAGGDSMMPIFGGNGRYVLFASSAGNLALTAGNTPFQKPGITLDVFLRDRVSNSTTLVSVNLTGAGGADQDALPVCVSSNGQFVLFESAADNLVVGDTNGAGDVFVRDVVNGTTILVSANTNGVSGNGASYNSAMTPDGRYVAFTSAATDLAPGDSNGIPDIFVRDLAGGTTRLVSVNAKSTNSYNSIAYGSFSDDPAITPDGRYVVFYSTATNLVPGQRMGGEIFERDLVAGTTTWISAGARSLFKSVTGSSNAISCNLRLSDDGNYVAFEACTNGSPGAPELGLILRYHLDSGATDLICTNAYQPAVAFEAIQDLGLTPDGRFVAYVANVNDYTGTNTAIYLWDAQTGTNLLISANANGTLPAANFCDQPAISDNGQYVAFFSGSAELSANASGTGPFAYLRDAVGGTTILLNSDTNGLSAGDASMLDLALSADGQCAAFDSSLGSLAPTDDNHAYDVFLRNITNGFAELASIRQPSLPSRTGAGSSTLSSQPISQDGRFVTFASDADGLAPGNPSLAGMDAFVCDLYAATNQIVSVGLLGGAASGESYEPVISGDGRYVAFTSVATNLIAADTNNATDVYIRDLQAQTTALVSVDAAGAGEGNKDSYSPTVGFDGRFVLFVSAANNLATGPFSGADNLFVRDRQLGKSYALTKTGQGGAVMTPDGRFIAFANASGSYVYLWDALQAKPVATNPISGAVQRLAISPDGNRIASMAGSSLVSVTIWDRPSKQTVSLGTGYSVYSHPGLRFSADGRYLTYSLGPTLNGTNQVYVYDYLTQSNLLVSQGINPAVAGDGTSDGPDISADGRFIVYRSAASNLVPGATNALPSDFLFDTATGLNSILSSGGNGDAYANNFSLPPIFSGDGHTLVFGSWGNDLLPGDYNQFADVFAYAFLYAAATANFGFPTINWPASADRTYSVQYKDDLSDPVWHPVGGVVTQIGNRGYLTDFTVVSGHRFYQVVADH